MITYKEFYNSLNESNSKPVNEEINSDVYKYIPFFSTEEISGEDTLGLSEADRETAMEYMEPVYIIPRDSVGFEKVLDEIEADIESVPDEKLRVLLDTDIHNFIDMVESGEMANIEDINEIKSRFSDNNDSEEKKEEMSFSELCEFMFSKDWSAHTPVLSVRALMGTIFSDSDMYSSQTSKIFSHCLENIEKVLRYARKENVKSTKMPKLLYYYFGALVSLYCLKSNNFSFYGDGLRKLAKDCKEASETKYDVKFPDENLILGASLEADGKYPDFDAYLSEFSKLNPHNVSSFRGSVAIKAYSYA